MCKKGLLQCSEIQQGFIIQKNSKFLLRTPQRQQPVLTTIGSLNNLLFFVTSARTLLGPFILMLSCTVIKLSSLCSAVLYFVVGHIWLILVYNLALATQFAWISCTAVHLYLNSVPVTLGLFALLQCTTIHLLSASVLSTHHRRMDGQS